MKLNVKYKTKEGDFKNIRIEAINKFFAIHLVRKQDDFQELIACSENDEVPGKHGFKTSSKVAQAVEKLQEELRQEFGQDFILFVAGHGAIISSSGTNYAVSN